ncbi:MAG: hypothetical protein JWQ59_668, partial [Cryobacterium sp.]|nr:hypothetical protein [Cryobacterium sp.]
EQAKGVLAEERHLGVNEAYEMLVQDAVDRNVPLSQWAAQILGNAR